MRWTGPELLDPGMFDFDDSQPTRESDCYSLGMVILEVFSGKVPFVQYEDFVIARKVIEGEYPERPEDAPFTDDLWSTLEQCWSLQPKYRPNVEAVLRCLGQPSISLQSPDNPEGDVNTFHGESPRGSSIVFFVISSQPPRSFNNPAEARQRFENNEF